MFAQFLQQRGQQIRPQGAVQPDGVRPQPLQSAGHGGNGTPGKGAPVLLKGHGHEHGQSGIFLHRQQGGLGLVQVGHGFNGYQVRPGPLPGQSHLSKEVIGPLEGQSAQRLQQLPQGPQVQGNLDPRSCGGLLGDGNGGGHHLLHGVPRPRQLEGVGSKGVGAENLRARLDVFLKNAPQLAGVGEIQQLRLAPGGQAPLLQNGAHGSVP